MHSAEDVEEWERLERQQAEAQERVQKILDRFELLPTYGLGRKMVRVRGLATESYFFGDNSGYGLDGVQEATVGGASGVIEGEPSDDDDEDEPDEPKPRMSMDYQRSDECTARCEAELKKEVEPWKWITQATVMEGHNKRAPGMMYGLEFPWSEQLLLEMGPGWLTKAFHAAGTLEADNAVTRIIPERRVKVTTGNNGGKFLFEVRYKNKRPGLHRKLFAKVPFALEGATKSDRLSSSVNKQPMELWEINSSRLLEATLPCKIPKFYFGDISNETSNWILITECVPFADKEPLDIEGKLAKSGERRGPLGPYLVEGPYDKCMDWTLRGDPSEYYYALVKMGAKMGGLHKAGKMGDPSLLARHFEDMSNKPIEVFGLKAECSGKRPKEVKTYIDMALKFFSEEGSVIFPEYCKEDQFQTTFTDTLLTLNAYAAEAAYWRHADQDYIALVHNNLNVDNAFFWRDEDGKLDLGVLDWGAMGQKSIGFKLWWWLYCGDYEMLTEHIDKFLQCFIDTYADWGGPRLELDRLKVMFVITALEQMSSLCAAIPQIWQMCKKPEWKTIKDRYDPRIGENINGKSTLRLYLQVMRTIVGIMHDTRWNGADMLEKWVDSFGKSLGVPRKDRSHIFP